MKQTNIPAKLAKPAQRALSAAGIDSLEKLSKYTEQQVMSLHGIGRNAMQTLQQALKDHGLAFAAKSK